jgi:D-beta-D-heptose 7-phosphate kinase/D-beta-D-heptose 1-phosphate adenosyltransferase
MQPDIPDFAHARILVIGDVMLDRYWHGQTSRISPEAPVPVVHVREAEDRPGGAANVAANIAALGAAAQLLGLTGDDDAARELAELLAQAGVIPQLMRLPGAHTVTKLRVLSRHQQLIRLDFEDGFTSMEPAAIGARAAELMSDVDAVVLSDYGKGTLRDVQGLIAQAVAAGKPVVVDPKGTDFSRYRGATVVTPNQAELEAVVGPCQDDVELVTKGEALRSELELESLLVTRSERGMSLFQRGRSVEHLPTRAQEVYDVTGAGDTVVAVLAAALAAGQSLLEATALSNVAAGVVVGKLGAAGVSVSELYRALHRPHLSAGKLVDEDTLATLVQEARAAGETVVMTNGCFDILHAGHVTYLEQARRLGDRLVVAVNDDASVARLKGNGRPVNPLAQRMRVLAGLESVDWVTAFAEDTPERLICRLQPRVLVKGGDYRPEQIAGAECVQRQGGRVVVLEYLDGHSTSNIIGSIRAAGGRRGGDGAQP